MASPVQHVLQSSSSTSPQWGSVPVQRFPKVSTNFIAAQSSQSRFRRETAAQVLFVQTSRSYSACRLRMECEPVHYPWDEGLGVPQNPMPLPLAFRSLRNFSELRDLHIQFRKSKLHVIDYQREKKALQSTMSDWRNMVRTIPKSKCAARLL
jgi:hypothetical protein